MNRRQGRPAARLAALAVAAGALWLAGQAADLHALREGMRALLTAPATAAALLAQELTLPVARPLPELLLLDQLPALGGGDGADESPPAETPEAAQPEEPEALAEQEEAASVPEDEAPPAPSEAAEEADGAEQEAPEEESPEEIEAPQEASGLLPVTEDADGEALELTNSTDGIELSLADYLARNVDLSLSPEGPQILIMHTHGTEAYTMADGDDYTESDTARTTDENYNMIRVGEEMKSVFEALGLGVVHDTSLYDYPRYTGSYARSLEGIRACLEAYPTLSVVLDVHRDALIGNDGAAYKVTDTVGGETIAQVMLVVGSNDSGLEHPNWEENLTLAAHIQARMMGIHASFPRPVNLRSQRFNQHMTTASLLVEVGSSGNTLREALAGARYFAQAAGSVYLEHLETPDGG